MIYFNVSIDNPFATAFESLWDVSGKVSTNKSWEIQALRTSTIVGARVDFSVREDHAGLHCSFGLFEYEIHFSIRDNRHWNYKEKRWENEQDYQDYLAEEAKELHAGLMRE